MKLSKLILYLFIGLVFLSCIPQAQNANKNKQYTQEETTDTTSKISSNTVSTSATTEEGQLADLFERTPSSYFRSASESESIAIQFGPEVTNIVDLKIKIFSYGGSQYTFVRSIREGKRKGIVLLKDREGNGLAFDRQAGVMFNDLYQNGDGDWDFFDPHVSTKLVNGRVLYIMMLECGQEDVLGASACISTSFTPTVLSSWSTPKVLVRQRGNKSASTAVAFSDAGKTYVTWSLLDDSTTAQVEDGDESVSSLIERVYFDIYGKPVSLGNTDEVGKYILKSVSQTNCTSSWDCNNQDIHDFIKEGDYYYAVYNGGNFYRCTSPSNSAYDNNWALSIRRSRNMLGDFNESAGVLINNVNNTLCGISYPTINIIDGVIYMYYSYYDSAGNNIIARSKLEKEDRVRPNFRDTTTSVNTSKDRCNEIIQSAYVHWLNRFPTNTEVSKRRERINLHGLKTAISEIILSTEGQEKSPSRSVQANVTRLYRALLLRGADVDGMRSKSTLLNSNSNIVNQSFVNLYLNSNEHSSNIASGLSCD